MLKIVETIDGRHIGKTVQIVDNILTFSNNDTMEIIKSCPTENGLIVSNSNYIVTLIEEE